MTTPPIRCAMMAAIAVLVGIWLWYEHVETRSYIGSASADITSQHTTLLMALKRLEDQSREQLHESRVQTYQQGFELKDRSAFREWNLNRLDERQRSELRAIERSIYFVRPGERVPTPTRGGIMDGGIRHRMIGPSPSLEAP